ncbi:MAG: PQQ-binding-like beta-propeller repeat protein [Polyangiaceae bacterium]|nr:PQQ-binding-like beta-propeller repeat protein [Polyangiaceae bacterium]
MGLLLALPFCWLGALADARPRDPTVTNTLIAASARTVGSVTAELPTELAPLWQVRVPGTITLPPAVDPSGALIVASTGGITELTPNGTRTFTRSLPGATAASSPAIALDGSRLVMTSNGTLVALSPSGTLQFEHRLPLDPESVLPALVVTRTGSVLVGAADVVLEVAPDGELLARTTIDRMPAAIIALPSQRIIVTTSGDVLRWRAPDPPRRLGTFGGSVHRGVARIGDRELLAVVDRTRLASLALATGTLRVLAVATGFEFSGPPVLTAAGETRVVTSDGVLLGHDRQGQETHRVLLNAPSTRTPQRGRSPVPTPLVMDREDRVAVAWPTKSPMVATADGRLATSEEAECDEPVAIVPLPQRTMAVICASGVVTCLGPPSPSQRK